MNQTEIQKQIAILVKQINFYRNHPGNDLSSLESLRDTLEKALTQLKQTVER